MASGFQITYKFVNIKDSKGQFVATFIQTDSNVNIEVDLDEETIASLISFGDFEFTTFVNDNGPIDNISHILKAINERVANKL